MPLIPLENGGGLNPSVIDGWWLGVLRTAANPAGALRVVKYMTSSGYQRMNVINAGSSGNWVIPTYPALMNGKPPPTICIVFVNNASKEDWMN